MTDWVLVPVEPTDAMISAGIAERHEQAVPEAWSRATSNIYRAMIVARPPDSDMVERIVEAVSNAAIFSTWRGHSEVDEEAVMRAVVAAITGKAV